MERAAYIHSEEAQFNEKMNMLKFWLIVIVPLVLTTGIFVISGIFSIVWLAYTSLALLVVILATYIVLFAIAMLKFSEGI